jgi:hypothetical protein
VEIIWPENCHEMSWKVHKGLYLFFLLSNGFSSNLKMLNTLAYIQRIYIKKTFLGGNNLTWNLSSLLWCVGFSSNVEML